MKSLSRTIAKVKNSYREDLKTKLKTPLHQAELWEVHGSGCTIKAFGHVFPGREYVLAKDWIVALGLARKQTGIPGISVTHPAFCAIL